MASTAVKQKLLQVLKGTNQNVKVEDKFEWLLDLKDWIQELCPSLQMHIIKGRTVGWLVIIPSEKKVEELCTIDVRVVVNMDRTFQFEVLKTCVTKGTIVNFYTDHSIMAILRSFETDSKSIICKGAFKKALNCKVWFEGKSSYFGQMKIEHLKLCNACIKHSYSEVSEQKRREKTSAAQIDARTDPSSLCNFRYLSQDEVSLRLQKLRNEKSYLKRKLSKLGMDLEQDENKPGEELIEDVTDEIEANYNADEARKCLQWIQLVTATDLIPNTADAIDTSAGSFHELLGDGMILLKVMDKLSPGKINWNDKTFQTPKIDAMRVMRERERIAKFSAMVVEYGVPDTNTFPTESLHEKGALNLAQVCVCIRALGIEAQDKGQGPAAYWPKKSQKNKRDFTDEQLQAGAAVTSLQYGTNKGASQAGMTMGKQRMIID